MLFRSPIVSFIIFTLLGSVLAEVPAVVYRGTSKRPTKLKEEGGFNCVQPQGYLDTITPQMHITKNFKIGNKNVSPMKDPWISTTFDYTTLQGSTHATSAGYIYKIDTAGREAYFVNSYDLDFGSNGHPYPREKEVPAWVQIPWATIMGWSRLGSTTYTPNPDYAGWCGDNVALRKRGLGAACAVRKPGAQPAPAPPKQNPAPGQEAKPVPAPPKQNPAPGQEAKPAPAPVNKPAPAPVNKPVPAPANKPAPAPVKKPAGAAGKKQRRRALHYQW